ncbi:MAG: NHLP family bacteriocin export ABC transporter peptidase/permease/ATPase subunit, partial [Roseiflexaceae bacterium]|nr:NHLP family bacteriocin export ABC transporter peptidase/permease/ATPase subunit [Roseiflexaceae bacterium]
ERVVEIDQFEPAMCPCIISWNNHFLVLEGWSDTTVYLNDPATGPRSIGAAEFAHGFTAGMVLLAPGPAFQRGGERFTAWRALQSRLAGTGSAMLYIVLANLALVIPALVIPSFTRVFVDEYLIRGASDVVAPLLAGMALTAGVYALLTWLQQEYLLRLETRLTLHSSSVFFWHVLRLPTAFFTQRSAGEISSRVGINDRVASLLSDRLTRALLDLLVIVFYLALMLQYDLVLTLVGVVIAALNLAVLRAVSRQRSDASQLQAKEAGQVIATSVAGIQRIETIKATGGESDFFARWAGFYAKAENARQSLTLSNQLLAIVPPLLLAVNTTVILAVGALRVIDGQLTVGMLAAFQALMLSFLTPVNTLVALGGMFQEAGSDLKRLEDVLRHPIAQRLAEEAQRRPEAASGKLSGHLELRNVSFGYNRLEPPLIDKFNLTLRPGDRIALVGGSGSGKSTIARLVAGLQRPWSGEILFDAIPVEQVPRQQLAHSFAVVSQDIFLFESTVRDNLTLWDSTVPEATLVAAAQDAHIHQDIVARPLGYDSLVVEGGRNWSGGQRQRLEIARALVGQPSLLVLDEATSALDSASEIFVDDRLRQRGCTCLIIAHRLSTIRDCDEIIVLDRGKIIQRGTHEELVALGGRYVQLISSE